MAATPRYVRNSRHILSEYNKAQTECAKELLQDVTTIQQAFQIVSGLERTSEGDIAIADNGLLQFLKDYQFVEPIASGASGVVFKARCLRKNEIVAIKLMALTTKSDRRECAKEIEIHSILDHENVVKLTDWLMTDKYAVLVEEYVPKSLLSLTVNQDGQSSEDNVRFFVKQIAEGLNYIHSKGIVHLDLKLDNILVSDAGVVKICDFGSAHWTAEMEKVRDLRKQKVKRLKRVLGKKSAPQFLGTPLYSSPESIRNDVVTTKSDMWSLGVLCFLLLGGYLPFAVSTTEIADQITKGRFTYHSGQWHSRSLFSRDFVSSLLRPIVAKRFSAREALNHVWLNSVIPTPSMFKSSIEIPKREPIESMITTVINNKLYTELKSMSLKFFGGGPTKQLAIKAFDMFEKYIENVANTWTSVLKYLHPIDNINKKRTREASRTDFEDKKKFRQSKEFICVNWVDDSEVHYCKLCDDQFNFMNRRHHCRKCGQIICGNCSANEFRGRRVCDLCVRSMK